MDFKIPSCLKYGKCCQIKRQRKLVTSRERSNLKRVKKEEGSRIGLTEEWKSTDENEVRNRQMPDVLVRFTLLFLELGRFQMQFCYSTTDTKTTPIWAPQMVVFGNVGTRWRS